MKVLDNGIIIEEPDIIEPIVNEPITFNNKQELNEYIENFIIDFLTEGRQNDNGTN
ncbi:MAG: hypothetical protein IJS60_08750 [Abditibacteriota bacterium]|nr:hypothetical protein [Abditibacteriota bacterium]